MSETTRPKGDYSFAQHALWTVIAGLGFSVSLVIATGRYGISLVTGLAMAVAIEAVYLLDRALLQPRLKALQHAWLRFGLQQVMSLIEHVGAALLALFLCSWVFAFSVWDTRAWWAVAGMLIGVPIVHGTETALQLGNQLREKERIEQRLRELAAQAELKALQAQINPHFLFNSLNTIAQLAHDDPAEAEATIERLAEMFRYVLAGSERRLIPLAEELAFVDGYLQIERARFGEQLRVTQEVDPASLDVPVPSLILQPLVENAVRHGRGEDGSIDLAITVKVQGDVTITVSDQGQGMLANREPTSGSGHGLRSVAERLAKTYGEPYGIRVLAGAPRGTVVVVRIPAGAAAGP
jgi:signal transduction histidine kinase